MQEAATTIEPALSPVQWKAGMKNRQAGQPGPGILA